MENKSHFSIFVLYLLSSVAFGQESSERLLKRASQLHSIIEEKVEELPQPIKNKTLRLLNQTIALVSGDRPRDCRFDRSTVYQEAFLFANSDEGMNLSRSQSQDFADVVIEKECANLYLANFKDIFLFAYSDSGMNKSRNQSTDIAYEISQYDALQLWASNAATCFISQYRFARSENGMGLSRSRSESHARKICLQQPAVVNYITRIRISRRLMCCFVVVKSSCTSAYTAVSLLLAPFTRPNFASVDIKDYFQKISDPEYKKTTAGVILLFFNDKSPDGSAFF